MKGDNASTKTFRSNKNGTTVTFYVNGIQEGTDMAPSSASIYDGTAPFMMSDNGNLGGQYLNGRLDEWGAWSRALSAAEITELYNGGAGRQYPF